MNISDSQLIHVLAMAEQVTGNGSEFDKLTDAILVSETPEEAYDVLIKSMQGPTALTVSALGVSCSYEAPGGQEMVLLVCPKEHLIESAIYAVVLDLEMEDDDAAVDEPEPPGPSGRN